MYSSTHSGSTAPKKANASTMPASQRANPPRETAAPVQADTDVANALAGRWVGRPRIPTIDYDIELEFAKSGDGAVVGKLIGTTLPKDSKVLLLTGSAGRDERKYPEAHRFDIHRSFDHHVSFGYGIHFCLGAALARMEGRIGIEESLARFPDWAVDRDRSVRLHTSTVRGWSSVPVLT